MKDKPLVSIITTSYNQGEYIEDTILSVKNQDYPNIEHIIVDGGSTDNTLEILKRYEKEYDLAWVSEPDKGWSDAINKGLRIAKGEIISLLNSDDPYFDKQVISCVVREFSKSEDVDLVYGDSVIIDQNNVIMRVVPHLPHISYDNMLRANHTALESSFILKASLGDIKLDTELDRATDYELWIRLLRENFKFKHIDRLVICTRHHASIRTFQLKSEESAATRLIQERCGKAFGLQARILTWWELYKLVLLRVKGIPMIMSIFLHRGCYDFAFNVKFDSIFKALLRQIAYRELVQLGIIRYNVQ